MAAGDPRIFIAPGTEEHLRKSVVRGVDPAGLPLGERWRAAGCGDRVYLWGVGEEVRRAWERVREGDVVVFYVTRPVSRAMWCARVLFKAVDAKVSRAVWGEGVWPYLLFLTAPVDISGLNLTREVLWGMGVPVFGFAEVRRGAKALWEAIGERCGAVGCGQGPPAAAVPEASGGHVAGPRQAAPPAGHEDVVAMVEEVGQVLGYQVEREYRLDFMKLDVVWFKRPRQVPTHAFEVQLEGRLPEALARLKHAYDRWGSTPVLIANERDLERARQLLEGAFHEISHAVLFSVEEFAEVHRLVSMLGDRVLRLMKDKPEPQRGSAEGAPPRTSSPRG